MDYHLSLSERETLIRWSMADKAVIIDTVEPAVIRKLDALAAEFPEVYTCTRTDEAHGAKRYTLSDKRYVRFAKPASEAHREASRAAMARINSEHSKPR